MSSHLKNFVRALLILGMLTAATTIHAQTFTDIGANLDGALGSAAIGATAWGDYDNDGDLDLAYTGSGAANAKITRLYRNDTGTFVRVAANLPNLGNSALAWGDYDNDGDLDLLLMGIDAQFNAFADIFRNDSGTFTALGLGLPGVGATVSWADFDNDGDLDILLAGFGLFISGPRLYRNDGANTFTLMTTTFPQINDSDGAWGDYDNDGDLDLVIIGFESGGVGPTAKIFRNDGSAGGNSWSFTDIGAGLSGGRFGPAAAWGDYDSDGDLDLALNGFDGTNRLSKIYRNNNGAFVDLGAGLIGVQYGDLAWGDYDNDGDLDLLLTGQSRQGNVSQNHLRIYRNNNGTFTDSGLSFTGMGNSSLAWADYDNDGDLDFFAMGADGTSITAKIFRNNGSTPNSRPSPPTVLFANFNDRGALALAWNPGSDNETPVDGLTYNLRVGATPGGSEIVAPMSLSSGFRQVAEMGNVQQNRLWTIENIDTTKTYYWSVQAIDNNFAGGAFAPEQVFNAAPPMENFPPVAVPFVPLQDGKAAWGDYDNDADLDVLIAGADASLNGRTLLYRNEGGAFTPLDNLVQGHPSRGITLSNGVTEINTGMIGVRGAAPAWGDFDNDGDLDVLLTGTINANDHLSKIYRNDGNNTFVDLNAGLRGVSFGSAEWGDYDNDGDLDVLLMGNSGPRATLVYRNDGAAGFTEINTGMIAANAGSASWGDYDRDGDLDVLLAGFDGANRIANLYRNDGEAAGFTLIDEGFVDVMRSSVAWGDYDNDGNLDVILLGQMSSGLATRLYRNRGPAENFQFTEVNTLLPGIRFGSVDWGDYDNDGLLDLLVTGSIVVFGFDNITRVYRNLGNNSFVDLNAGLEPVSDGRAAWGDYDDDGDLDILLTGEGNGKIYRNNTTTTNTRPSAPTGLTSAVNGQYVTLSWNAASDNQTTSSTLSYNLRIGATPGGQDVLAPMYVSGPFGRQVVEIGNANHARSKRFKLAPNTTYYWSVQALDQGYAGSVFATEQSFTTGSASTLVRLVNSSADPILPNVDIYLGSGGQSNSSSQRAHFGASNSAIQADSLLLDDLGFLQSSPFLIFPADAAMTLAVAPGNSQNIADTLASFGSQLFTGDQNHIVILAGVANPNQFAPNPEGRSTALNLVRAEFPADISQQIVNSAQQNMARIIFLHTATDAPAVDLIRSSDGGRLIENIGFGEASAVIAVEPTKFEVEIFRHNTRTSLGAFKIDLRHYAGAVTPVMLTGFLDPAVNQNGAALSLHQVTPGGEVVTRVEEQPAAIIPTAFALTQNYPNPFNPATSIHYSVASDQLVSLKVYDVLGKEVATLVDERKPAGTYRVSFDAAGRAGGVYFVKMRAGEFSAARKILLMR